MTAGVPTNLNCCTVGCTLVMSFATWASEAMAL